MGIKSAVYNQERVIMARARQSQQVLDNFFDMVCPTISHKYWLLQADVSTLNIRVQQPFANWDCKFVGQ